MDAQYADIYVRQHRYETLQNKNSVQIKFSRGIFGQRTTGGGGRFQTKRGQQPYFPDIYC